MLDLLMVRRGAPRPGGVSISRALKRLGGRRGGAAIALSLAVALLAVLPVAAFGLPGLVLGFLGVTLLCVVGILLATHG